MSDSRERVRESHSVIGSEESRKERGESKVGVQWKTKCIKERSLTSSGRERKQIVKEAIKRYCFL